MGLFGKNKTTVVNGVVTLVKDIRGMVDDKQFTSEERSRYYMGLAYATTEFAKSTMSENTERSRTRRSIAEVSVYFFYFLTLLLIGLWRFDSAWFDATKALLIEFKYPAIILMIMAFFFGGYYLNKFVPQDILKKKDKR